jgi:hypothetical protein
MATSAISFRDEVLDRLLALLWRQWSAIGVAGYAETPETQVVDPEALLLLTLTVARHDARLYDAVLEWLDLNGDFLNAQRLQNLAPSFGPHARAGLGAIADRLSRRSAVALKWRKLAMLRGPEKEENEPEALFMLPDGRPLPMPAEHDEVFRAHGLLRAPVISRGVASPFPAEGAPAMLLRLRALLGVNIRCEVLCLLGTTDEIHPSQAARLVGQAPRTMQDLLADMARSGAVQVRTSARAKYYALVPGPLDELLRPQGRTPWRNSVPLFQALEAVWLGLNDTVGRELAPPLLASQWRRTARFVAPLLGDAGLGQPLRDEASYVGETYQDVYVADFMRLLARL